MLHELYRQWKREGVRAPATPCLLELDGRTVLGPNTCEDGGGGGFREVKKVKRIEPRWNEKHKSALKTARNEGKG